jgi:FkbM family methyltransferase
MMTVSEPTDRGAQSTPARRTADRGAGRRWLRGDDLNRVLRRAGRRLIARGTVPLPNGRVLTTNPDGRFLYVDGHDTSLTPSILLRRRWEPGVTRLFCRLLGAGDHVLEVGSNIGWYTLLAAERVGPEGRVFAFEPNPTAFDLLQTNVFVNGLWDRCRLDRRALSDRDGTATLHVAGSFLGSGRLRPFTAGDLVWQQQPDSVIESEAVTLDEVLTGQEIDIMKVDVEGSEPDVFAGGDKFFAANESLRLVFEYTPGEHGPELLRWMRGQRFELHTINRLGRTRVLHDDEALAGCLNIDLLAVRG